MASVDILKPKTAHPMAPAFYQFYPHRMPSPGSQNWIFEPKFGLPLHAIADRGVFPAHQFKSAIQPPQVWYNQAVPQAGYGGLQAGQIVGQGLIAPDNENTTPF